MFNFRNSQKSRKSETPKFKRFIKNFFIHHYIFHWNPDVFLKKKQRARKVPIHIQDTVNRLSDTFEQNEIISPVSEEQ